MSESTPVTPPDSDLPAARKPWQFSLRSLFVLTAVVAVLCSMGIPISSWLANLGVRTPAHRTVCQSHMRQLTYVLHYYQQKLNAMPPAHTIDATGRPLHSWRTLVLPWLQEMALYQSIDLQQPWNAPANKRAAATRRSLLQCPSHQLAANETPYVLVTGPGTLWPDPAKPGIWPPPQPASDVVVLVELKGLRLPWIQPRDMDIATLLAAASSVPPSPMFDCHFNNEINVAFADGHVELLTPAKLAAALQKMQRPPAAVPKTGP